MKNVAIVTGASRGIGAATAILLAKQGYAVAVNYNHSDEQANSVVNTIRNNGGEAIAVKADIGHEDQIIHLFETTKKQFGPITALVNNAGINGKICSVEDLTTDCLQSVFKTNVYGTFICCREAVKHMRENTRGSIVNVSSEAGRFGGTKMTHYAASKAAINTFTVGFAREVAPYNIRVNTVSPGVIDTDLHRTSPPERIEYLLKTCPLGRMGTTDELAETISWLLSDKASYITGSIIPVTGAR